MCVNTICVEKQIISLEIALTISSTLLAITEQKRIIFFSTNRWRAKKKRKKIEHSINRKYPLFDHKNFIFVDIFFFFVHFFFFSTLFQVAFNIKSTCRRHQCHRKNIACNVKQKYKFYAMPIYDRHGTLSPSFGSISSATLFNFTSFSTSFINSNDIMWGGTRARHRWKSLDDDRNSNLRIELFFSCHA